MEGPLHAGLRVFPVGALGLGSNKPGYCLLLLFSLKKK